MLVLYKNTVANCSIKEVSGMKKKEGIKQPDKLWKAMKTQLKTFLKTDDQDDLHQFRIYVKKLKAMLTLYSFKPENKGLLKHFKPVKRVFGKAGNVRNAYVNLKLGEKHRLNDEHFNHHQQKTLDKELEEFKNKGSKYLKQLKKTHTALQNNLQRMHNKTIRNFYQDKLAQAGVFFTAPNFGEEMHTARKNIKLLVYNQALAAKALKNKQQINLNYLDELQNAIGQWHDHNLALETLSKTNAAGEEAVINIKNSNAYLEQEILELAENFKERVGTVEDAAVKVLPSIDLKRKEHGRRN